MKEESQFVEMVVAGLVLDPSTNSPIVILKEPESDICLPIWIGLAEATAIASALKQVEIVRPMTHDLLCTIVESMSGNIARVVITDLDNSTFIANVEVTVGDQLKVIDSRPSDAIAIAVRMNCPVVVNREVLEQAQVTLVAEETEGAEEFDPQALEESDQDFSKIDKDKWEDILAQMDPDDFKYKM